MHIGDLLAGFGFGGGGGEAVPGTFALHVPRFYPHDPPSVIIARPLPRLPGALPSRAAALPPPPPPFGHPEFGHPGGQLLGVSAAGAAGEPRDAWAAHVDPAGRFVHHALMEVRMWVRTLVRM